MSLLLTILAATAPLPPVATTSVFAASVVCGGEQPASTVNFPVGSAVLDPLTAAAQQRAIRAAVGTNELVGYRVLEMGDLSEGHDWDSATTQARLADQALARARGAAVLGMLRRLPSALRSRHVSSRLLPNRPVSTPVTGFNERTGVIIEIGVRYRDANGVYIAC